MDRIEKYQPILQAVVNRHAQFQSVNGQITTHAVCDLGNGDFMVIDAGWNEKGRRIYDVVLHFRLSDGKVFVERDNTDSEVVRELLEKGIAAEDIILTFNSLPNQKLSDVFAAL